MPRYFLNLNIGDFLRDTQGLSTLNKGAYLLLLMHYTARGSLPTDEKELRRITGLDPRQWKRTKPELQKFFDGQWRQGRVERDLAEQDRISVLRKLAGQAGGRARAMNARARRRH